MLEKLLQKLEGELQKKHKFITDELKELAKQIFPNASASIERAYKIAKVFELKYWAYDELVDESNLERSRKYELLILVENAFFTLANIEDSSLKSIIIESMKQYLSLPLYEQKALELAQKGLLYEAINTLLEGKSLNARFYVAIFNYMLNTSVFSDYVSYRKLFLLVDDLKDLDEDLKNGDVSVATILYYYGQSLSDKEIISMLRSVWDKLLLQIQLPILKQKAIMLEEELIREIKVFLYKRQRVSIRELK